MIKRICYYHHMYGCLPTTLLMVACCSTCSAETMEAINLPDRTIDWSRAGVWMDGVKGISDYPVGVTCATPACKAHPNQTTDRHNVGFRSWLTGDNYNPSVTMNKICADVEVLNQFTSYVGNVLESNSLDWPAFGPDVASYVKTTPSKLRWDTYVSSGRLSDLF